MRGLRIILVVAVAIVLAPASAAAQTIEWARTTVGATVGTFSGYPLWSVASQTVLSSNSPTNNPDNRYPADQFLLRRNVSRGATFALHATRFISYHLGLTAELAYIGNSPRTSCQVTVDGGDPDLAAACAQVGSNQKFGAGTADSGGYHDASGIDQSGGTTTMQAGVVFRPLRPAALAPFLRAGVGIAEITHSAVAVATVYGSATDSPVELDIYNDYHWKQIHLVESIGVGVATAPTHGLIFSAEARWTFIGQTIVAGSTSVQGQQPPTTSVTRAITTLALGIELGLGRRRGKRY